MKSVNQFACSDTRAEKKKKKINWKKKKIKRRKIIIKPETHITQCAVRTNLLGLPPSSVAEWSLPIWCFIVGKIAAAASGPVLLIKTAFRVALISSLKRSVKFRRRSPRLLTVAINPSAFDCRTRVISAPVYCDGDQNVPQTKRIERKTRVTKKSLRLCVCVCACEFKSGVHWYYTPFVGNIVCV